MYKRTGRKQILEQETFRVCEQVDACKYLLHKGTAAGAKERLA
jgi:hypothetical protein